MDAQDTCPDCTNADGSTVSHGKPTGDKHNHTAEMDKAHADMNSKHNSMYPSHQAPVGQPRSSDATGNRDVPGSPGTSN